MANHIDDFSTDHRTILALISHSAPCRESDLVFWSGLPLPLARAVLSELIASGHLEGCVEDPIGLPDLMVIPAPDFDFPLVSVADLPDLERELLRMIFFAPYRQTTLRSLTDRCYHPEPQVQAALDQLLIQGYLRQNLVQSQGIYKLTVDALEQLQGLDQQANQHLEDGLRALRDPPS